MDAGRLARRRLLAAAALLPLGQPAAAAAPPDDFIDARRAQARIPGLSVAAVAGGRVLFARGYGLRDLAARSPATADSMFHIASITKTVTATAVMQLVEGGRIGLDDAVDPHLDFRLRNPRHPGRAITFRHLLTHTSGISDARYLEIDYRTRGRDSPLTIARLLHECLAPGGRAYDRARTFSAAAPGARWDYCNLGFALLGHLATRIAGQDMREQARRGIFAPLGMDDASWTLAGTPREQRVTPYDVAGDRLVAVPPVGFPDWSAGMLRASAASFARFLAASANAGSTVDARLVQPATMARMLAPGRPDGLPDWLTGQALGWMAAPLDGRPLLEHWGGDPGVFTAAYVEPATRCGALVFTNTTATPAARDAVKAIAARLMADARAAAGAG